MAVVCSINNPLVFPLPEEDTPIWIDNVSCRGSESSLDQCSFDGFGVKSCPQIGGEVICAQREHNFSVSLSSHKEGSISKWWGGRGGPTTYTAISKKGSGPPGFPCTHYYIYFAGGIVGKTTNVTQVEATPTTVMLTWNVTLILSVCLSLCLSVCLRDPYLLSDAAANNSRGGCSDSLACSRFSWSSRPLSPD